MSCNKTQHLLKEYFSDDLLPVAKSKIEEHLFSCAECSAELESLLLAQSSLTQWREQRVPHWDRGLEQFRREQRAVDSKLGFWSKLQWFPLAASVVMLTALMLNTQLIYDDEGFMLSFGATDVESKLQGFIDSQRQNLDSVIQRIEDKQDINNIELLEVVLKQTQQATAENLDSIYALFEQQRLRDLEDMKVGYQQLIDSDYETIRSLQRLAQFVSYRGQVR